MPILLFYDSILSVVGHLLCLILNKCIFFIIIIVKCHATGSFCNLAIANVQSAFLSSLLDLKNGKEQHCILFIYKALLQE